jgi:hypothetical protein
MSTRPRRLATRPRKRGSRVLPVVLILLTLAGITTVALGVLGAGSTPTYSQPAPALAHPFTPKDTDTYTGPTALPNTAKTPSGTNAATTGPMVPLEVSVPSVGLRVSIVEGGLTAQGAIDLPTAPLVAHYTPAAALDATQGSTVIAGHVDMFSGSSLVASPMSELANIQKGAPIFLTDAKGLTHRYKATSATLYNKHALPQALFQPTGPRQLVLLTCGGPLGLIDGHINYLQNMTITALPWP